MLSRGQKSGGIYEDVDFGPNNPTPAYAHGVLNYTVPHFQHFILTFTWCSVCFLGLFLQDDRTFTQDMPVGVGDKRALGGEAAGETQCWGRRNLGAAAVTVRPLR